MAYEAEFFFVCFVLINSNKLNLANSVYSWIFGYRRSNYLRLFLQNRRIYSYLWILQFSKLVAVIKVKLFHLWVTYQIQPFGIVTLKNLTNSVWFYWISLLWYSELNRVYNNRKKWWKSWIILTFPSFYMHFFHNNSLTIINDAIRLHTLQLFYIISYGYYKLG